MDTDATKIRALLYRSIRALAGLLMDVGVSAREFVELSKLAFVDAAIRKSQGSKPPSIARLVDRTGLSKHDVSRLKQKLLESKPLDTTVAPRRETTVLRCWYTDPDFLGQDGRPRPLSLESLADLVARAAPEDNPERIVKRLFQHKHVKELATGEIMPIRRDALAPVNAEGMWTMLLSALQPICLVMEHNMNTPAANEKWLQRTAYCRTMRVDQLPRARQGLRERGGNFIQEVDDFMQAFSSRSTSDQTGDPTKLVGFGVFYFEEPDSEA